MAEDPNNGLRAATFVIREADTKPKVDIHSHILWDLDDGAKTIEDSLEMLRMAAASGTIGIVATPHANSRYEFSPTLIEERIQTLTAQIPDIITIHRGCDFHLNVENIEDALSNPKKYTINGRHHILVEFPDVTIPLGLGRVFNRFLQQGMVPIITHPERNDALMRDIAQLQAWVEEGCLIQVTAMSILGTFGKKFSETGWELMDRNLVHFIASDAHDPQYRHTRLDEAMTLVAERRGQQAATLLFETNPQSVVTGKGQVALPEAAERSKKKAWFGLFG